MTKEQKRRLYEAYKLDWMLGHGYSIDDIFANMFDHANDADYIKTDNNDEPIVDADCIDIVAAYEDWEREDGFDGEIWASFKEFCDCELTDRGYIHGLIERMGPGELIGLKEAYDEYIGA